MDKITIATKLYHTNLRKEIEFYLSDENYKITPRVLNKLSNHQKPSDFISPIIDIISGYKHDYRDLKKIVKERLNEDYEDILFLKNKIINLLDTKA